MRDMKRLAELVRAKNEVESEIASIVRRPAIIGHVGEYIASRVFKIKLEQSASQKGIDGFQNLKARGVKLGVATSVVSDQWEEAEIYPQQNNKQLVLTKDQLEELSLFR